MGAARHHRENGRNHAALMLAQQALRIPFPSEDALFVETEVYAYKLWEEIMISAWYVAGRREIGFAACERLLLRRGHDDEFYDYVTSNESFYHAPLRASVRDASTSIRDPARRRRRYKARTQRRTDRRARVFNVRLVNDEQDGGRSYTRPTTGCSATATRPSNRNSGRARVVRRARARDTHDWPTATEQLGLEDMRWTLHAGRVWFTAACYQSPSRSITAASCSAG